MRRRILGVALAVLIPIATVGVVGGASAVAAKVQKPTVSSFAATPAVLYDTGGSVTLSAVVNRATSCQFTSRPAVASLPPIVPCSNGTVSQSAVVPANHTKKAAKYKFYLTVSGSKTVKAKVVLVTVSTVAPPPPPPPSPSPIAGVRAVVGDYYGSCAILTAGGVECWGNNVDGQLGNGTTGGPDNGGYDDGQVVSGITNATSAASIAYNGFFSYCALLVTGKVDCWGDNNYGELGNGTTGGPNGPGGVSGYDTPQLVVGISNAVSLASDSNGYCAVLASGKMDCWGDNGSGQLGIGAQAGPDLCIGADSCYDSPQTVSGMTDAAAAVGGVNNFCAVLTTGGVDCWGNNQQGLLGIGSIGGPTPQSPLDYPTPQAVKGIPATRAVESSNDSYCAVLVSGGVDCWGMDYLGQLGNGTVFGNDGAQGFDSPQVAIGITEAISVVANSGNGYCALLATGGVDCWGDNEAGQLGNGTINGPDGNYAYDTPQAVIGITSGTSVVSDGNGYCVVLVAGTIECWGDNEAGQLGNGTIDGPDNANGYDSPQSVTGITKAAAATSSDLGYCAVLTTGGVDCWGNNADGQLGNEAVGGPDGAGGNRGHDAPQAVIAAAPSA